MQANIVYYMQVAIISYVQVATIYLSNIQIDITFYMQANITEDVGLISKFMRPLRITIGTRPTL